MNGDPCKEGLPSYVTRHKLERSGLKSTLVPALAIGTGGTGKAGTSPPGEQRKWQKSPYLSTLGTKSEGVKGIGETKDTNHFTAASRVIYQRPQTHASTSLSF